MRIDLKTVSPEPRESSALYAVGFYVVYLNYIHVTNKETNEQAHAVLINQTENSKYERYNFAEEEEEEQQQQQ